MWDKVHAELDVWHKLRRQALFWWRDDDAIDVTPQLKKLAGTAKIHDVSVGLSVIPVSASAALKRYVRGQDQLEVLVHGYAHKNHARANEAKREFPGSRHRADMLTELKDGLRLIRDGFGAKAIPVLVPPWNRIPPSLVSHLPALGYAGISAWKPRPVRVRQAGFVTVNAHLDVIDWRRGKIPKAERLVGSLLLRKLRWRRENPGRASEPLGILTHHLLWDDRVEALMKEVLQTTRSHPAARWMTPREVFGT
jgi:hypothetical protein